MKRLILFLISVIYLSLGTYSHALDFKPYAYPFIGKWNPSDDPLLLDDYGYQDIQNMRRDGKRLKGVKGHTYINENDINATYYKPRSGTQFIKDDPVSESHILIQAYNADETASGIYQNKTIVPNRGEFEGTALHTDHADASIGRFTAAPNGNMAYCNGEESLIWGGDEMKIAGFYTQVYGQTPGDQWAKVLNNDSSTYADLSGLTTFYVGANRRISKAKLYIGTGNATASTLQVYAWTLSATTWAPVAGLSDGTASGGKSLADSGTVSWTYNTDDRSTFVEDTDILAYWYKFVLSAAASSGTTIYHVTCAEGAFRTIEDLWDGLMIPPARAYFTAHGGGTTDYTSELQEDSVLSYVDLGRFESGDSIVVGFTQPVRGISVQIAGSNVNANASALNVDYHNGVEWSGVTALYDGTKTGDVGFNHSGWLHWMPIAELTGVSAVELKRTYEGSEPLYYYSIGPSAAMTGHLRPYYIEGIPAQPAQGNTKLTPANSIFPASYQGRLWLFQDNVGIYSALGQPDVFNGEATGSLTFGNKNKVAAAGTIYNVFLSTGYEQLIVTKASETYRVHGTGPEDWVVEQISPNVGCVAPQSFAVCDVADVQENVKRNVAIWQSSHGFVQCDGATVQDISNDIDVYFNRADGRAISRHRIDDTVAWYDPDRMAYHALISSGAEVMDTWGGGDVWHDAGNNDWGTDWNNSITAHNVELVYSLRYQEWTKIYREDASGARPLQVGFQAKDNDGKIYTYGAADNGIMYRLENGKTWDGIPIAQYVHTKDLMLDDAKSIFNLTTVKYFRVMFTPKTVTGSGETIYVDHYGDGSLSVLGTSNQSTVSGFTMDDTDGRYNQDVVLGEALKHSFKIYSSTSSVDEGMELLGMALWYESFEGWRE